MGSAKSRKIDLLFEEWRQYRASTSRLSPGCLYYDLAFHRKVFFLKGHHQKLAVVEDFQTRARYLQAPSVIVDTKPYADHRIREYQLTEYQKIAVTACRYELSHDECRARLVAIHGSLRLAMAKWKCDDKRSA